MLHLQQNPSTPILQNPVPVPFFMQNQGLLHPQLQQSLFLQQQNPGFAPFNPLSQNFFSPNMNSFLPPPPQQLLPQFNKMMITQQQILGMNPLQQQQQQQQDAASRSTAGTPKPEFIAPAPSSFSKPTFDLRNKRSKESNSKELLTLLKTKESPKISNLTLNGDSTIESESTRKNLLLKQLFNKITNGNELQNPIDENKNKPITILKRENNLNDDNLSSEINKKLGNNNTNSNKLPAKKVTILKRGQSPVDFGMTENNSKVNNNVQPSESKPSNVIKILKRGESLDNDSGSTNELSPKEPTANKLLDILKSSNPGSFPTSPLGSRPESPAIGTPSAAANLLGLLSRSGESSPSPAAAQAIESNSQNLLNLLGKKPSPVKTEANNLPKASPRELLNILHKPHPVPLPNSSNHTIDQIHRDVVSPPPQASVNQLLNILHKSPTFE
ncbi:unnamed protein product [[Candida] boidinii]|uniref:Unnamed protein product n=1 Tax=Candida boidinii TaxID=5477 RepID=A0A9W6T5C7_CANBO|nr:unnamed protein product [[Candida] boidinii]